MPLSPQEIDAKIEPRIRTMRTLWLALVMSVVIYFIFTLFIGSSASATPNNTFSIILAVVGMMMTLVSIPIRQKVVARAVQEQKVAMVQQGYITALAVVEVSALLGMLDFFVTGNRFYFVPFLIAIIGQLIHFPRRQDVLAASFKNLQ